MTMVTMMTMRMMCNDDIVVILPLRLLEEFKEQKLRKTLDYNVQLNSLQVGLSSCQNRLECDENCFRERKTRQWLPRWRRREFWKTSQKTTLGRGCCAIALKVTNGNVGFVSGSRYQTSTWPYRTCTHTCKGSILTKCVSKISLMKAGCPPPKRRQTVWRSPPTAI